MSSVSINENSVNSIIVRDNNIIGKRAPNAIELNNGDASNYIPHEITIFASDLKDSSTELSINASLAENVSVHKLSRFIFPREDPGPTAAGKTEIPDLHCLEYAVNLACHRLDDDLKQHWDDLCTRDVSYPEVSKNGILTTNYDLKNQITLFNKSKEKERYVNSLANKADLDILAAESYPTHDFPPGQGDESDYLSSSSANIFGRNAPKTIQKSPLFVHPNSGQLVTFIQQCKDVGITLIEGFNNLINERKNHTQNTFYHII